MSAGAGASDGTSDGVWFISHAGADRAWAEWLAWQPLDADHEVELDCWDWGAGDSFIAKMNAVLEHGRMLALFSPAYFDPERFTTLEYEAMLAMREKITPVRIADVTPPPLLRPLIAPALFGLDDHAARETLLQAVNGTTGRPDRAPGRPPGMLSRIGGTGPRLPGSLPRVRNLSARNAAFTGRDSMLVHLREALASGQRVAVQALHGRGGVGKTQLALEYAYRVAGEYELAWWIASEDPALIPDQLGALAVRTGIAPAGTPLAAAVELLLAELGTMSRWLLVFDNAETPDTLAPFLPGGPGHVLITSRNSLWTSYAVPVDVDTLSRTESMALLRARGAVLTDADADDIGATLDDLPLALAQAAALLVRDLSPADLKEELAANLVEVMARNPPPGYPTGLAAQVRLTRSRLKAEHPGAAVVVDALALLAPEPFPLTTCAGHLPEQASALLVQTVGSRLAAGSAVEAVARHGLARVQDGTLQLHRLTQDMLAQLMTGQEHGQARADVEALLAAASPGDSDEPRWWPAWQVLLPHLLAVDPASITTEKGRDVVRDACWYLMERDQARPARERLEELYDTWSRTLGPDHEGTLWTATSLARAYGDTQDHERARALDADTLERRRQLQGEDHPDTLTVASNLAVDLADAGRVEEALVLEEETLARQRRVVGMEHHDTLLTASNLAIRLAVVGRVEEALVLGEETLARQRRVLGEEHPETLFTASNLAIWLAAAGRVEEALVLGEETLARQRRVLGEEHPDTLNTANNLAVRLRDAGRVGEAVVLGEETLAARRRVLGEDHPETRRTAAWVERLVKAQAEPGAGD
ncbi:FxSxx-COOH system tetratricopeptide repeat protein [Streptomyces sp. NBC_00028]|uniref:FxSxx-COOH system tetratricopeptide repeat protein n=1 Tax=Streptomyces sp. NBC_00028 TaxID=2975624 RepID=UPI0032564B6F